ncbi:hypothetical protein BofuT4_P052540.1 [Botrytis cinerea T4]|uniref:Uncharacterized protein n=1 Tax=Botryotinia fuckeliana (strain T4) TaxID=999810 RepID=G2XWN5_BOTF4|nr:hypothetical protein BofuT4_P052540.1 [Botrytis cinerea T4]
MCALRLLQSLDGIHPNLLCSFAEITVGLVFDRQESGIRALQPSGLQSNNEKREDSDLVWAFKWSAMLISFGILNSW